MKMPMPEASDNKSAINYLGHLEKALTPYRWVSANIRRGTQGAGCLQATCAVSFNFSERIIAATSAGEWYSWWSWLERIGHVDEVDVVAKKVADVLRPLATHGG